MYALYSAFALSPQSLIIAAVFAAILVLTAPLAGEASQ
jgi:hypothetical protein